MFSHIHTIAIIGLSPDESKDSHIVGKYLLENGFEIIPIYPRRESILGRCVYTSIKEAIDSTAPDAVVVFRKSEACLAIAKEVLESNGIEVVQDKYVKIEHSKCK